MSMFSGLTNQFSNLLGKGEGGEGAPGAEQVPAEAAVEPQTSTEAVEAGLEGEAGAEGGKAGVFSGVSSKMTGWLSNAPSIPSMPTMAMPNISMPAMPSIPSIPGLRKTQTTDEGAGGISNEALATSPDGQAAVDVAAAGGGLEEDDRSSATGGADSRPNSPIADEEAGQIGNVKASSLSVLRDLRNSLSEVKQVNLNEVTGKVTAGAKSFGSFLYSAVNKAGDKIKETALHNPILDKFNKEQDAFIKSQGGADAGVAPWLGHQAEDKIKEEILALSADRRNFVRAPPAGIEFEFNYDQSYPVAVAIMTEDKQLEQMRFELVPKIITEEQFWRNYFYRVSLIVEAGDLGTLGSENEFSKRASSEEVGKSAGSEEPLPLTQKDASKGVASDKGPARAELAGAESEFVSDTVQTTEEDLQEVREGMRKLGIDTLANQALESKSEEQWEKDLEAELQDYEVVNDGKEEEDVDDLLDDLK